MKKKDKIYSSLKNYFLTKQVFIPSLLPTYISSKYLSPTIIAEFELTYILFKAFFMFLVSGLNESG